MRLTNTLLIVSGLCCGVTFAQDDPYAAPASYYSSVTGTGATLKGQLTSAMSAGHTQRNYGNFRDMSRYIDVDPDNPSNILLVYNRASVSASWDSGATWNREHVWPQSRQPGSASNSSRGNLGDPHALRPANPSINSSRGNKPFGGATATGNHRSLGTFYFPGDVDKGDIARSLFYSDTRYAGAGMSLVSGSPSGNQMGDLDALLAWHYLDIPDAFERRRNHAIYSADLNPLRTNNRNAYVDHPEFVWSVYVDQMNDSTLYFGQSEPSDGASGYDVDLGAVLVGETVDPINFLLRKSGEDGTYYRVTSTELVSTNLDGPYRAFPIGSGGATQTLRVDFDPAITDNSGLCFCSVTVDNLDVTDQGGAGNGANDGDDVITFGLSVYDQGNGSFADDSDLDTLTIDLGAVNAGAGDVSQSVSFFNIPAEPLVAPIDIELLASAGDTGALPIDFADVTALGNLGEAMFNATLDDAAEGEFSATYTFRVYNDRVAFPGAAPVEDMTLTLTGLVETGAMCPADLAEPFGSLNFFDVSAFLSAFSAADPSADFNDDGAYNFFDVSAFLSAFADGCP